MIDTKALHGLIVSNGMSQKDVAEYLNMAPKTFYLKMKKGVFGSDEMESMIRLLGIEEPQRIFFAKEVT